MLWPRTQSPITKINLTRLSKCEKFQGVLGFGGQLCYVHAMMVTASVKIGSSLSRLSGDVGCSEAFLISRFRGLTVMLLLLTPSNEAI